MFVHGTVVTTVCPGAAATEPSLLGPRKRINEAKQADKEGLGRWAEQHRWGEEEQWEDVGMRRSGQSVGVGEGARVRLSCDLP